MKKKDVKQYFLDLLEMGRRADCEERERILRGEVLDMNDIYCKMMNWASIEARSDEQVIKIVEYLYSFESFQEIESFWFYQFNPDNTMSWDKILHLVYVCRILGDPMETDPFEKCDYLMNLIYRK